MTVTGAFISTAIAIVLFSSVATIEASPTGGKCSENADCSASTVCFYGDCINPCDYLEPHDWNCHVENPKVFPTPDPDNPVNPVICEHSSKPPHGTICRRLFGNPKLADWDETMKNES